MLALLRIYAPRITFPVAVVVGFIGYHLESRFSKNINPPYLESVQDKRAERLIDQLDSQTDEYFTLKEKKFVPKTVFERNVPPHLKND